MELIDKAREALYRLDGQIASEDGMIIENALTALEMSLEGLKKLKEMLGPEPMDDQRLWMVYTAICELEGSAPHD